MTLKADRLLYTAVAFVIIGLILYIAGPYLPIPPIIPLAIASICFVIVIITVILALCNYQRDYAQSRGRDFF
jgi:tellurite resistance protein TehA-like permease